MSNRYITQDAARKMEGYMVTVMAAMSRNWNIKFKFTGTQCCFDGDTISVPYNTASLSEDCIRLIHSDADHECCHAAEEEAARAAGRATPLEIMRAEKQTTIKMLFNVWEDIRIENKYSAEYPGTAENLRAGNEHSANEWNRKVRKGELGKNFWHELGCALIYRGRGMDPECTPEMLEWLGILAPELADVPSMEWAEDSLDLAVRTYAKVRDVAEQAMKLPPPPPPQSAPDGTQEPDDEQGDDGSGGESKDGNADDMDDDMDLRQPSTERGEGEPESGDEKSKGDEKSDEKADGDEKGDEKGDESGEPDPQQSDGEGQPSAKDLGLDKSDPTKQEATIDDLQTITKDDIQAESTEAAMTSYVPDPASLAADIVKTPRGLPVDEFQLGSGRGGVRGRVGITTLTPAEDYEAARQAVAAQIATLATKTQNVIRIQATSRRVGDQESGTLDPSALYTLRTGGRDVYTQIKKGLTLDAAIMLLVDLSGSMGHRGAYEIEGRKRVHRKSWHAHRAVIGLSETFNRLNIPFEVIGFHTTNNWQIESSGPEYSTRGPMIYQVFKSFSEPLRKCRERFSAMTGGQGSNCDGEAVHFAALRLAKMPQKRKIMFHLSDGLPRASGVHRGVLEQHLKDVISNATSAGIDMFGIGIQTEAVTKFYNKSTGSSSIVINDLDQLAIEVYKVMRQKLLRGVAA